MTRPPPMSNADARVTVTPYCFYDGEDWRYYFTASRARRTAKLFGGKIVWEINRETGKWKVLR